MSKPSASGLGRTLYGPAAIRPVAQDSGDGALWVDPSDSQALWQVQSGNWVRIAVAAASSMQLSLRGAHNRAATYAVGDLVTDAGGLYACTVAVAPQARSDTFARADQDGWGVASDGHTWQEAVHLAGTATIASARGLLTATSSSGEVPTLRLGAGLAADDAEMLVRWRVTSTEGNSWVGPVLALRAGDDGNDGAFLSPALDGTYSLSLNKTGEPGESDSGTIWAGGAFGAAFWTRVRAQGQVYSLRTWADGAAEPTGWDHQYTADLVLTTRRAGLGANLNGTGDTASFDHVSATPLAPSPTADTGHWEQLVAPPSPPAATTTLQLDWAQTTDLSALELASATWTDLTANQSFTVTGAASLIEVQVTASCFFALAAGTSAAALRCVIDSAGTPVTALLNAQLSGSAGYVYVNGGSVPVSGLAAGAHTIKLQGYTGASGTSAMSCRTATNPNTEFALIRVLERHPALAS